MVVDLRGIPSELRPFVPEWACMTPERLRHVHRVAALVARWAGAMLVPDSERNRWLKAVWLHDALRDATDEELLAIAPSVPAPARLRHGPASAALAKAHGETDRGVLDAVRFHSVGLAEWDMVGRVLYCADWLEPGRPHDADQRAALANRFPAEPHRVVREVAERRLIHLIRSGWTVPEPTYRLWNSLVTGSSASSR